MLAFIRMHFSRKGHAGPRAAQALPGEGGQQPPLILPFLFQGFQRGIGGVPPRQTFSGYDHRLTADRGWVNFLGFRKRFPEPHII